MIAHNWQFPLADPIRDIVKYAAVNNNQWPRHIRTVITFIISDCFILLVYNFLSCILFCPINAILFT